MSEFRAEIDIVNSSGNTETLVFNKDRLKSLRTRTFCTNNPTQPVFDVFANDGTIVIKDIDLSLYNRALQGDFDNTYKFDVRLYKGTEQIAYHIVNQRPKYDFANKTLTLNLGNNIDILKDIVFKGYSRDYEENFNNIIIQIFSTVFQKFVFSSENKNYLKYKNAYPYLSETYCNQALKQVCEATNSSLIETSKLNFKFINMSSIIDNENLSNKPIYKLLPKHINNSFTPNIILDNRFTNIIVNALDIYEDIKTDETVLEKDILNVSLRSYE